MGEQSREAIISRRVWDPGTYRWPNNRLKGANHTIASPGVLSNLLKPLPWTTPTYGSANTFYADFKGDHVDHHHQHSIQISVSECR